MRTKEIEKITHVYFRTESLRDQTKNVSKIFPIYMEFINELYDKSRKLYYLNVKEGEKTKTLTSLKKLKKDKAIKHVLKLKRGVVLHAVLTGNKSLQRASEYTYSDFNRPSEEIRTARFHQILNAAKRMKHPEQYGLSKGIIAETERLIEAYCKTISSPALRKRERARQAKQCRRMLDEINFLLRKKMAPLMENIAEEFPNEALAFKDYLNPSKIGRPANKPQRKQRILKTLLTKPHTDKNFKEEPIYSPDFLKQEA
ncbi:MAG: hypothetical protein ABI855_05850 [Bacteroidota bacterium]